MIEHLVEQHGETLGMRSIDEFAQVIGRAEVAFDCAENRGIVAECSPTFEVGKLCQRHDAKRRDAEQVKVSGMDALGDPSERAAVLRLDIRIAFREAIDAQFVEDELARIGRVNMLVSPRKSGWINNDAVILGEARTKAPCIRINSHFLVASLVIARHAALDEELVFMTGRSHIGDTEPQVRDIEVTSVQTQLDKFARIRMLHARALPVVEIAHDIHPRSIRMIKPEENSAISEHRGAETRPSICLGYEHFRIQRQARDERFRRDTLGCPWLDIIDECFVALAPNRRGLNPAWPNRQPAIKAVQRVIFPRSMKAGASLKLEPEL